MENWAEAADTKRGVLERESNNCMGMSPDDSSDGFLAMKVKGWTADCAIALWSESMRGNGAPCDSTMPFKPDNYPNPPRKPDHVFTLQSPEAFVDTDDEGNAFVCISPLNDYVQSN